MPVRLSIGPIINETPPHVFVADATAHETRQPAGTEMGLKP